MKEVNLFQTQDGWITSGNILALLEKVGAADAKVLYMHTGITFGAPDPYFNRQELLGHLYELIQELGIRTLIVPTFTFSFCNGEDYCLETTRSRMGALNEYIRKLPGAVRSIDPLMSSVLIGENAYLVTEIGSHSIGENCTFDKLHRLGSGVKFLFFGTTVSECFTYTHYVEERLRSPYRYDRPFTGNITVGGRTWQDTYTLFVRYQGVTPTGTGKLEKEMLRRGFLRKVECGGSSIAAVDEPDAYETIVRHLNDLSYCYIAADPRDRNAEFQASNMVAL